MPGVKVGAVFAFRAPSPGPPTLSTMPDEETPDEGAETPDVPPDVGRAARELGDKIEAQTKGYRDIVDRVGRAAQPSIKIGEQFGRSMPKLETSDRFREQIESLSARLEPPRSGADIIRDLAERRAEEHEELAREREHRDALEAARHDAMLSALDRTAGSVESLLIEQRAGQHEERNMLVMTIVLGYLGVVTGVLIAAWTSGSELLGGGLTLLAIAGLLVMLFVLRKRS